ncbi:MAG TPA: RIP metalloprotease RseP [Rariglobus sp.]|jgi:regulator of sigma E protease|nr:RIP metalloprotease RseP [Rariglobus sp.]
MDLLHLLLSNLWSVLLIVIFFGGSIFVHELGHFLAARKRGMIVERFSIGFGPKIFSWHGKDGVEYRLSWLPLGGYVALPQLADMRGIEGESKTDISKFPAPTYSTKMIVSVAGAVCNVLFALALACIVWGVGLPTTSELNTTQIGSILDTLKLPDGTVVPSPAAQANLHPGDIIRAVDGKPVDDWLSLMQTLASGSGRTADGHPKAVLSIDRAGQTQQVTVLPRLAGDDGFRMLGIEAADDLTVEKVAPDSPAALAGLQPGDTLTEVDGRPLYQLGALAELLQKTQTTPIHLTLRRGDQILTVSVAARPEKDPEGKLVYRIGVQYRSNFITLHPSPFKQLTDQVTMTWRVLTGVLNPKSDLGPSKLSGPIGIVRGFHTLAQVDIRLVLWFTILINVNLAIFNLLPIPVLDGGHMLFATIAKLRGRSLPVQLIATTQSIFMVLLLFMMIYVGNFDLRRWLRDNSNEKAEAAAAATAATPAQSAPAATPAKP